MSRDLHRADVVFCVFDGRPTQAAHQQVFLEHRRVGSGQRIHDVGFGDRVELSRAAIAISKHASYYGDNGAKSIGIRTIAGTRTLRWARTHYTRPNISLNVTFTACSLGLLPPASNRAVGLRMGIWCTVDGDSMTTVRRVTGPGATSISHLRNSSTPSAAALYKDAPVTLVA